MAASEVRPLSLTFFYMFDLIGLSLAHDNRFFAVHHRLSAEVKRSGTVS
ncbi:MAG: hypothetical protein ACRYFU_15290 [Janthinobacterium lividum]